MSRFEYHETDRFAIVDERAIQHQVIETTRFQIWRDSSGGGRVPTTKRLDTIAGLPVNFLSEGQYEIISPDGDFKAKRL